VTVVGEEVVGLVVEVGNGVSVIWLVVVTVVVGVEDVGVLLCTDVVVGVPVGVHAMRMKPINMITTNALKRPPATGLLTGCIFLPVFTTILPVLFSLLNIFLEIQ